MHAHQCNVYSMQIKMLICIIFHTSELRTHSRFTVKIGQTNKTTTQCWLPTATTTESHLSSIDISSNWADHQSCMQHCWPTALNLEPAHSSSVGCSHWPLTSLLMPRTFQFGKERSQQINSLRDQTVKAEATHFNSSRMARTISLT